MITRSQIVEMGHYNKPHGVNGELSATMDCDLDVIKGFSCLISEIDGIFVPFFVESLRPKSSETVLLKIDGINNETDAALLVNKPIYVKKEEYEQLSDEYDDDAMPLDFFIGYAVTDNGNKLGTIVDVDEETDNCLFVVRSTDGLGVMIPASDDLINDIDTDKQVIDMSLPQGLIDVQTTN